jgi:soluble lytic murein transglycosylase-like protein
MLGSARAQGLTQISAAHHRECYLENRESCSDGEDRQAAAAPCILAPALFAMRTVACFRRVALSVLAAGAVGLGALSGPCSARADIFLYTDEDGAQHVTNIPGDARYQRVLSEGGTASAAPAATPAPPREPDRDLGRERYALPVAHAAADTGLPEGLLHAVIKAESNYNPEAVSHKGAVGLMQLMPETARRFGVSDARDPAANVLGGARYLKTLLAMFDADLALALAAYNAGPAAVLRSGRAVPPYAETQRYVPRVLELYRREGGR